MRNIVNSNAFFRNNDEPIVNKSRFWLEMFNNQNAYKQMLIGHIDGATNDSDDD